MPGGRIADLSQQDTHLWEQDMQQDRRHSERRRPDALSIGTSTTAAQALEALAAAGVPAPRRRGAAQHLTLLGGDPIAWLIAGLELGRLESELPEGSEEPPVPAIREIERLMNGFAGELEKLDEVVEVIAAYLRRLRDISGDPSQGPLIH
jgi:hypothetical protein